MPVIIELKNIYLHESFDFYTKDFRLEYFADNQLCWAAQSIQNEAFHKVSSFHVIEATLVKYFVNVIETTHGVQTGSVMHENLSAMITGKKWTPVKWTFPDGQDQDKSVLIQLSDSTYNINGVAVHPKSYQQQGTINGVTVRDVSSKLPGMDTKVPSPCNCYEYKGACRLWSLIQHLNDEHDWTREAIADWLDKLHDDGIVDIEFKEPVTVKPAAPTTNFPYSIETKSEIKYWHTGWKGDNDITAQSIGPEWVDIGYTTDHQPAHIKFKMQFKSFTQAIDKTTKAFQELENKLGEENDNSN